MPSGHTEMSTINERRPLTPGMRSLLRSVCKQYLYWNELSRAEKNQMGGLMDRGYVEPFVNALREWHATEAGHERNQRD